MRVEYVYIYIYMHIRYNYHVSHNNFWVELKSVILITMGEPFQLRPQRPSSFIIAYMYVNVYIYTVCVYIYYYIYIYIILYI